MRRFAWIKGGVALAALAGVQCGYPDFMFTGGTGDGGSGPKACRLTHGAADCGAEERCTLLDTGKGTTGCVPLSKTPVAAYALCKDDMDCPAGTWCDYRTDVCMTFCETSSDCGEGNCVSARNEMQKTIPGASVCTAHCDPLTAAQCGGATTCSYDGQIGDFDCYSSGSKSLGESCTGFNGCKPGLVCSSTDGCLEWCHPAPSSSSADCPASGPCANFGNLSPMYGGEVYGYCQ